MTDTIRSRLLVLPVSLLILVSISIITLTVVYSTLELRQAHRTEVRDMAEIIGITLSSGYDKLLDAKVDAIVRRRELMASVSLAALRTIEQHYQQSRRGLITEAEAKAQCLEYLAGLRYGQGRYFFVYDASITGLEHPSASMVGKSWSGYRDNKNGLALPGMLRQVELYSTGQTVFSWPRLEDGEEVRQLGFFRYFRPWQWVLGTSVEIEDIAAAERVQKEALIKNVQKITQAFEARGKGFITVFDTEGNRILPREPNRIPVIARLRSLAGGDSFASWREKSGQDLRTAAWTAKGDPAGNRKMRSYIGYFPALDWFYAITFYNDKLTEPVRALVIRQASIIGVILILGIGIAVYISRKIVHPLKTLEAEAARAPEDDSSVGRRAKPEEIEDFPVEIRNLFQSFIKAEDEVREHQRKLRDMGLEITRVEERERRRLAGRLHDNIAQTLAYLKIRLQAMKKKLDEDEARPLEEVIGLLTVMSEDVRGLISEIGSPVLYELGLEPALEWLCEYFKETYGLEVRFEPPEDIPVLNDDLKAFLFRAARELLTNVVKHAGVKQARLSLELESETGRVVLGVKDAGRGFEPSEIGPNGAGTSGYGIFSLRERVRALGGSFHMEAGPDQGTEIRIATPM